ncbi:MAG: F0F1 ATP synthase subunit gamma [Ancrocorticia sp.]|uniref:F0F1 ATP synthase subunit gamma n=1 Tax=Ancrocorticia sp. TaxID=2593684 RepID=UPI003F8EA99C
MAGKQRAYKEKIRATATLEKVFRAMELIAASRISRARETAQGNDPYTRVLTEAIATVAGHSDEDNHPLLSERTDTNRVAVLVVTSDRGMAGAYSASVLREADRYMDELRESGKEPVLFVTGRRGISHYSFRGVELERTWAGESDRPSTELTRNIADALLERFLAPEDDHPVAELHVVFTRFESMVRQVVQVRHMLPMEIVDTDEEVADRSAEPDELGEYPVPTQPVYEFEPSAKELFDQILPLYVRQRISNVLSMAAASELASRQQAMHSATENAGQLIEDYTRLANNARQTEITTELTEIVSGADALKTS